MDYKGYFSKVCYADSIPYSLWGNKSISGYFPPAGMGDGEELLLHKG